MRLKRWTVRFLIALAAVCAAIVIWVAAGVLLIYQRTNTRLVPAGLAASEFASVRRGFADPDPMIVIGEQVIVRQPATAAPRRRLALHVLAYDARSGKLVRSDVPHWLLEFVTVGGYIRLANTNFRFWGRTGRVTLGDLERYGPGVILDLAGGDGGEVLVWTS